MMLDTDRMASSLVILDGRDLTKGPLAKINLPHHIPLGGWVGGRQGWRGRGGVEKET